MNRATPLLELDGGPVSAADATALALHNYGHFTTMRVADMRVRGLACHMDRLVRDCRILFDAELDTRRVRRLVRWAAAGTTWPTIVRATVFAPDLDLADPAAPVTPRVLVSRRPAPGTGAPPIRLKSVPYRRDLPAVKHVGLLGTVHHRRVALLDGFDDALFVDGESRVVEGATWNVGFYDGDRVMWPDAECLPGVTMRLVTDILDREGVPSVTMPIGVGDLADMRSGFITNAAIGVRPIESVDGVRIGQETDLIDTVTRAYAALPGESL
jgi:branched-subunit amino acid aminotransferase/4-amino-4-deoxychorismate lyase